MYYRVQFGKPGRQNGSTAFGAISVHQNEPRKLQVALKVIFGRGAAILAASQHSCWLLRGQARWKRLAGKMPAPRKRSSRIA